MEMAVRDVTLLLPKLCDGAYFHWATQWWFDQDDYEQHNGGTGYGDGEWFGSANGNGRGRGGPGNQIKRRRGDGP
jgi:hypothetical protein